MALDPSNQTFVGWTQADVDERKRFGQSKFERLANNQHGFDNRLNNQGNAWSMGDDAYTHFGLPLAAVAASASPGAMACYEKFGVGKTGSGNELEVDHLNHMLKQWTGGAATERSTWYANLQKRADIVPMELEVRSYVDYVTYANVEVFIGFHVDGSSPTMPGASRTALGGGSDQYFIGFTRGLNTDTYDALSWGGGTGSELTRTTSLSGINYTSWDRLKVTYEEDSAKFYVHDGSGWVLKAAHTVSLPNAIGLYPIIAVDNAGDNAVYGVGTFRGLATDLFIAKALSNVVSP